MFVNYLILALATWRISAMLSYEDGPWFVFRRLRKLIGIMYYEEDDATVEPDTFFGSLFGCVWCLTIWIGTVVWIAYNLWPDVIYPLVPFALSAGAIMIERFNHG